MKNFQLNSKKLKSEKGSITLFVLTTMLFILGVLVISYMGVRSKVIEQDKRIKQIQEEYNTVDINQQYSTTVENLELDLQILLYEKGTTIQHQMDQWTNKTLTAKVIWPEDAENEDKKIYIKGEGEKISYIEGNDIEEYSRIRAEYKNRFKNAVANIDKDAPDIHIEPKELFIVTTEKQGNIKSKITVEDNLSRIKEVKYAWSVSETQPAEDKYEPINVENGANKIEETISEGKTVGTHYLWIKAVDNVGNEKNEYAKYIITNSVAPTVIMKYTNVNGEEEYNGEWTNQNIYTEIVTNELKYTVKNYEYSTDYSTYLEIGTEKTGDITFYEYAINNSTATYIMKDEGDYTLYFRDLYEDGTNSTVTQEYKVRIDKTEPTASLDYEYTSQEQAKIEVSDIVESGSGIKGYYISTEETEPTQETTWVEASGETISIENLSVNTNYNIWLIDNVGNISKEKYSVEIKSPNYVVDDKIYVETLEEAISRAQDNSNIKLLNDYEDASTATIDKNITFDVQSYTLTRTQVITINSGKIVTITGSGTITSSTNNHTISNAGILVVDMEGKIESNVESTSYYAILNNGTLTIENGIIDAYYRGIYATGPVNVNGGTIKGKTNGIYQNAGTLTVNGGTIEGDNGVYQNSNAIVNILGGKIKGYTNGIYGTATNKITIGDSTSEVNKENPIVSGGLYGICMKTTTHAYNFYNGIIMGDNTTPYTNTIVPRVGYMVYTYYDYDVKKYVSILDTSVENITIEQKPTEWTNQNVELQVRYPVVEGVTLQFSEDGENWKDVNNGYITKISENKMVYARMLDSSGIIIENAEHDNTNIDKIAPTLSINPETTKYTIYDQESTTVDISVAVTLTDEGGSGLNASKYGWSNSREEEPTKWVDFTSGNTITKSECEVGTYYLWFDVSDVAGNKADINVIKYIVELQQAVAKIGDNYYYTIQEAIDVAGTTASTVEIIKDTNEVATVQEGQNITMDIQGHTIGGSSSEQAVITNNGILQIIDTSETKTGAIENLVGTAIINNGTIVVGDNNSSIEDKTPIISGKKIGISNKSTLNYYDGTIKGKVAIQGEVQNTPESYGPVGVYENGITTVNLRVISDYVARIEWTYYTVLQDAFDVCEARENNETQTTVVMLKDIVLDRGTTIARGQNVRLNLNGYTLTSTNGSVITNNGKLDIADLTEGQTGSIYSSVAGTDKNYYKLINNQGEVIVNSGNIASKNVYNYPIYNGDGRVNINGGKVSINNSSISYRNSYVIYNASEGEVNVTQGIVSNESSKAFPHGIYNAGSGIINVSGGTINGGVYGIYNVSTGIVNVTGGTIDVSWPGSHGIYNKGSGTINVSGGTVSSSSSSYELNTGIYNASTGEVNVTGGTVSSNSTNTGQYHSFCAINNQGAGIINISGGTVKCTSIKYRSPNGVNNASTGTINITGGTITSSSQSNTSNGINNASTGTINITGGIINSNSSNSTANGISNTSTGIINLGTKGNGVVSDDKPHIISEYTGTSNWTKGYGISNLVGTFNFYDGIIQSSHYIAKGGISEVEDNYEIVVDEVDGYKTVYLAPVNEENYIIENVKTGKKYASIKEAINRVTEEAYELKLLQDIELSTDFNIPEDTNVKLDLNGKTITNNYFRISNYGNLEITDSTKGGKINNKETICVNFNKGNINFIAGELSSECNSDYAYGIYNASEGDVRVSGGIVSIYCTYSYAYGIYNASNGEVNVENGTVSSRASSNNGYAYGIYNASTGTINAIGGNISGASDKSSYGIANNSTGEVNLIGSTVTTDLGKGCSYGIINGSSGTINMTGGIININNGYSGNKNCHGIYNASTGTINMTGGNINNSSSGTVAYGINNVSTGTINLGTKGDGIVSNTDPHIISEYAGTATEYSVYGIYNASGTFNFYDGKIEGSTRAIPEEHFITEIEENTTPLYENDNKVLTLSTGVIDVAKIGEVTYGSLQEAIDTAGTDETTIELLRGIQYTNTDKTLNIAENQNIILDLNGFSIVSAFEDAVITNDGNLKITDSSEEAKGRISSNYEMTINNEQGSTLELEKGTITRNVAKDNVVYNQGTVNVTGGTILQPGNSGYSIYNVENSVINISGGTISGGTKGIYNIGNTNITGGIIEKGINNNEAGNLKIENGTITGEVTNRGTVEMTGGSIENTRYGIYSTAGTVTIGTKNGEINQISMISGTTSGIYSTSTLEIYDGIIKGKTSAINGIITEIEYNSEIVIETEENYETLSLVKVDTPLAQVGDQQYYLLKEAINSISGEGTVTILREGIVADTINIQEMQNITLDLNGNTLKMYTRIQNSGTLEINDTSAEKTGVLTSYKDSPIYNSGNLTLTEGTISGNSYGIYNEANGTTNIEGGNLTQNTYGVYAVDGIINVNSGIISENTYGIFAYGENAIVNISGGSINANKYGVYNGNGTSNITEGEIISNSYGIYNNAGITNISGGTINGNAHEVYNGGEGTINIISGSIITTSQTAITNASSGTISIGTEDVSVTLDNPIIQAEEYGITNSGNGTIKFYDGTIKGRKGGLLGRYLYTESGYTVKTEYIAEYYTDTLTPSGTISTVAKIGSIEYTNLQSAINACTSEETTITLVNSINTNEVFIVEEGQNIIIDLNGKGVLSATVENIIENVGNLTIIDSSNNQTGKITNTHAVAINNLGTLNLGQDDGTVSTTCPEISGTVNAIKNTGTFNFYDGIIKASVAVDGKITSRANGYVISKTNVNAVEQLTLSK